MIFQQVATVVIVAAAIAYLVWKLTRGSRPVARRRGPDVPTSRLVRRQRKPPSERRSTSR